MRALPFHSLTLRVISMAAACLSIAVAQEPADPATNERTTGAECRTGPRPRDRPLTRCVPVRHGVSYLPRFWGVARGLPLGLVV